MFKNLNKFTIAINAIALIAIFYDIFILFNKGTGGLFGAEYLFAIYFLSIIYSVCFLHLFFYKDIKNKIKITLLDLLPIFLFSLIVNLSQETKLEIIIKDTGIATFKFYLIGGLIVLLLNIIIHKTYLRIKNYNLKNEKRK